ncbi:MAG TPA: type IV pilus twitching motility protein PilT, partial [Proteobacteria bacterium]|nr:type IV pilus twitching motility protein PilT [Pseudomonadota bacterium]
MATHLSMLEDILKLAIAQNASDIHLKPGLPAVYRINGRLLTFKDAPRLSLEHTYKMAYSMMDEKMRAVFEAKRQVDLAYSVQGLGRFRVNIYQQRGTIAIAMRPIPSLIRTFKELNLPQVLEKICAEQHGLVLLTGTTGCGKSTTLAAMIDYINSKRTCHIVTIEDPIEYLIQDRMSIISQREVGFDAPSFLEGLRAALRQDPDVIMVGEMRDLETIETAMHAAETGHLVMSTLHTLNAVETVNRIISMFPSHQQEQVRYQLANILKAVVSQRLIARADGRGRIPAVEVLISTARIRQCIRDKTKTHEIQQAIEEGTNYGMQSFDQSLID